MDNPIQTHPSYGVIKVSRATGGPRPLFGSSIEHNHTILLKINHAAQERLLNSDYVHQKAPIVEIELSQTQFAEMVSSIGQGEGIPCTIKSLQGKLQEPPPGENKQEQHRNEFAQHQNDIIQKMNEIIADMQETFEKKSITKADKERLLKRFDAIRDDIGINSSFQVKMFDEQMEKTVHEAKGEVEAFIQNKINQIAAGKFLEQAAKDIVSLPDNDMTSNKEET